MPFLDCLREEGREREREGGVRAVSPRAQFVRSTSSARAQAAGLLIPHFGPTHPNSATQGGVSEDRRKAVLDEAEEERKKGKITALHFSSLPAPAHFSSLQVWYLNPVTGRSIQTELNEQN